MNDRLAASCKLWSLEPDGPPTDTATSWLQRVRHDGDAAFLKCPKPESDETASSALLDWYGGDGSVRLLRSDRHAQLLEWIEGPPLSELVRTGRDSEAAEILASVATRLHRARPGQPLGLESLAERFSPLTARRSGGDPLHAAAADVALRLLETSHGEMPLHGDLHHDNILRHPDRGWLAIDPKGLLGDPHHDLANALCNPIDDPATVRMPDRLMAQAEILAGRLALDLKRLLDFTFSHACLAEIWCDDDGQDPTHWRQMAQIAGNLRTQVGSSETKGSDF